MVIYGLPRLVFRGLLSPGSEDGGTKVHGVEELGLGPVGDCHQELAGISHEDAVVGLLDDVVLLAKKRHYLLLGSLLREGSSHAQSDGAERSCEDLPHAQQHKTGQD